MEGFEKRFMEPDKPIILSPRLVLDLPSRTKPFSTIINQRTKSVIGGYNPLKGDASYMNICG